MIVLTWKRGSIDEDVIIIGTGGHAKVVADIVLLNGDNLKGFLTNDQTIITFLGKPVLGLDTDIEKPGTYIGVPAKELKK